MTETKLNMLLQVRRDDVFVSTYKLEKGEPGFEISTNTFKIGDGQHTWAELPIANEGEISKLIKAVDDKFANYTETKDLPTDLGDFTNDAGYAKTTDVNAELANKADKTQVAADIAEAIAPLATTEALNLVKATAEAAAVKKDVEADLALKADKSVVDAMYTNSQIDGFIAEAKLYADNNDADTKYGITYDSDAKKIKLVEGGTTAEIDASAFIKDGMISNVTIGDDNDLVITFNTDAGKDEIVLPLDQLVDIYTGVKGARIEVTVSSDKKISAELAAGSITKNYLDSGVQASLDLADSALQSKDLEGYATEAFVEQQLSDYDDTLADLRDEASTGYRAADELAMIYGEEERTADDYPTLTIRDIAADEIDVELIKGTTAVNRATNDADGNNIATTYATKAELADLEEAVGAIDVGVEKLIPGNGIVIDPAEGVGEVTVSHATYTTGEYTRDPATSDKTGDQYFFTGVTVDNGHVTGANVKSLAAALEGMTFIFDGGTSGAAE